MIKILLVDDDLRNSMLLKTLLEAEDFEVLYANNGAVGWELYNSYKPHLILLDINMPELNGFELAKRIREEDSKVTIFFLSDRVEKIDRLKGFSLKGNDYIPKPFYPEELVAKINERFGSSSVATESLELTIGSLKFMPALSQIKLGEKIKILTDRQCQILEMFVHSQDSIVERGDILRKVWGNDSYENSLALNVQITYLRRILELDKSVSIISLKGRGYILKSI